MPRRISWKKGMRLTDEVLKAADNCTSDAIGQALVLASAGRMGLFPSVRPFQLSLSIARGFVEVESLDCLAMTRGGDIIDVQFDTKFSNTFDSRVQIPQEDEQEFLLTINLIPDSWKESVEGYQSQDFTFSLVGPKTAIPDHSFPIARIVNKEGWEEDTSLFVPPCLYVSSHSKFEELYQQFINLLKTIDEKTKAEIDTQAKQAISIYWPVVQQILFTANTEHETMTPMSLLSGIQRVIGIFTCACELDDVLNLEDADTFRAFARIPYNHKNAYLRIKQGLGMCYAISEKIEKFSLLRVEAQPKPSPKPEPPKDDRRRWNGPNI